MAVGALPDARERRWSHIARVELSLWLSLNLRRYVFSPANDQEGDDQHAHDKDDPDT
jgi:hypothetical protein